MKWRGIHSKIIHIHGGGPQGGLYGIIEYLSQSNDNANMVDPE